MKAQKWVLAKQFDGEPKDDDMILTDFELSDELQENEVLCEALYLTVDPYMRVYVKRCEVPMTMFGEQVARVTKSRNEKFKEGSLVLSYNGWISHFISNGSDIKPLLFELGDTPLSYTLGTLGMTGATAYFGLKLMEPKKGEILVVNGAAGAVGSVVGQLAKIYGCTTIGFVGSEEKLEWCKNELGFDHVFNYKTTNFSEAISQVAPDGVDLFFDNVGGEYYHTIINKHMRKYGRASLCGSIENYNDKEIKLFPATNNTIVTNELRVQGFIVLTFLKDWPTAFIEMNEYIKDGRLKVRETIYDGFNNMQKAFYGLFKGENIGKAIVKV